MDVPHDGRGILYPARLPSFHRMPPPETVAVWVRWFWIPSWQLAPGRTSRQEILPFPASNLTVMPEGVSLSGPSTRITHRDLTGTGWAVGALLRPVGAAALGIRPADIRDTERPHAAPGLQDAVTSAMADGGETGRRRAVKAFTDWLLEHATAPGTAALTANMMEDLIATDRTLVRVEQVAEQLHLSIRSVQRFSERYLGVPPLAVIRRYRLQEAAHRLRENPNTTVAEIAADLGYTDHAHLTTDFRRVLGSTPRSYRREALP